MSRALPQHPEEPAGYESPDCLMAPPTASAKTCLVLGFATPEAKRQALDSACASRSARCAEAGGALLADLSLEANLNLAADCGRIPAAPWLPAELAALCGEAGMPGDAAWWRQRAASAPPLAHLHARLGRALAADPDWLLIDADAWPDELVAPEAFSRAFLRRHPWRGLAWLCAGPARSTALRTRLAEVTQ